MVWHSMPGIPENLILLSPRVIIEARLLNEGAALLIDFKLPLVVAV